MSIKGSWQRPDPSRNYQNNFGDIKWPDRSKEKKEIGCPKKKEY